MFFLNVFTLNLISLLSKLLLAQTTSSTQVDQSNQSTFFSNVDLTSTITITKLEEITSVSSTKFKETTTNPTTTTSLKITTTTKWNPNNCGIPVINPFLSNYNFARIINGETAIGI
jgi:hypothetical protein